MTENEGPTPHQFEVSPSVASPSSVKAETSVIRGPASWNYIYIVLGFAISIEATVIGMISLLPFPYNIVIFASLAAVTFRLILFNTRFHNKLFELKKRYEDKPR